MIESPALQVLSRSEQLLLTRIEIEHAAHGGKENGRLPVTYADFAEHGIDRHSILPAQRVCAALGFIEITRHGRAGNRESLKRYPTLFRLTYMHVDGVAGDGTHEWRKIETLEQARTLRKAALESCPDWMARRRRQAQKQKPGGESPRVSVGNLPTENAFSPVGKSPTTVPVGKTPPLSISRAGVPQAETAPHNERNPPLPAAVPASSRGRPSTATRIERLEQFGQLSLLGPTHPSFIGQPNGSARVGGDRARASVPARVGEAGKQMFLLQRWGVAPDEAHALVTRWHERIPAETISEYFASAIGRGRGPRDAREWILPVMQQTVRDPQYSPSTLSGGRRGEGRSSAAIMACYDKSGTDVLSVAGFRRLLERKMPALGQTLCIMAERGDLIRVGRGRYRRPPREEPENGASVSEARSID